MGLPNKFMKMGSNVKAVANSYKDFFDVVKTEPHLVLADAKKSITEGVSYGKIQTYKYYTNPFLRQNKGH